MILLSILQSTAHLDLVSKKAALSLELFLV
jgi:hypothetical protein